MNLYYQDREITKPEENEKLEYYQKINTKDPQENLLVKIENGIYRSNRNFKIVRQQPKEIVIELKKTSSKKNNASRVL